MTPEVFEPCDAASLAAKLKWANGEGLAIAIRGAGTKQTWGAPSSRTDVVLSTLGLNTPIDHVAGDLVATVPAGAALDTVNDVLRRERQWLPLDPGVSPLATVGGVIATNDSGPRRHRYGTPRDLIIGIEIALADGRTAKAGGRVVKNVAGYDLSKLLCGSLGTLAVITRATFKLSPVAPVSYTLVATVGEARRLGTLALAIAGAPLSPSTIEVQSPPHRLLIRFETSPDAAERQTAAAGAVCTGLGSTTEILSGQAEADAWRAHERHVSSASGTIVKLAILPTDVAEMLARVESLTAGHGVEYAAVGRAALGVILVRLGGDPVQQAAIVADLRRDATARRGSAVLLSAPPDLKAQLGPWGPIGDAAPIMRAVKSQFDPRGTLNPGRGPWEPGPS
jgi:glycolate oxidase FAD binding subunit